MTDPAPAARTTLRSIEELADEWWPHVRLPDAMFAFDQLTAALAAARAEGRRQALEEAERLCDGYSGLAYGAAALIRRLAGDAPQTPKDLKPDPEPTP